jgi:hypothetical protein
MDGGGDDDHPIGHHGFRLSLSQPPLVDARQVRDGRDTVQLVLCAGELVSTEAQSSSDDPPSSVWWFKEVLTTQVHASESEVWREVSAVRAHKPAKG